jgi:Carboxypeptidase regulatory-like domain/TonB dependent receptor
MKTINSLVLIFLGLLFAARPAFAQGVGTSGNISGTVTDPTGGVVPKVSITAVETARGAQYTGVTDDRGQYRITGVPSATYDVSAQVPGFGKELQKGVVVSVGLTAIVDFHLKVATSAEEVVVSAEPPVVETERGSQADTLTQQYIEDLPIDRRDYLTFTLLLPGVSDSTRLAGDQDFRVKQTPQSGLSFYGSNGRGNSITVDGGETQDDAGGVRLTLSQDAVQEFQVNRSNYGADLGGASGASINIVSKSGTNNVHGTFYSYFRNDVMDAQDPFAFTQALQPSSPFSFDAVGQPIKNSLSRYQYGGDVGMPIQKDKTFLFLAFEGLLQNSENAVPLLTDSSIFLGPTLPAPTSFATSDPRAGQQAIVTALATAPGNPMVPCLNIPQLSGPPIIQTLPAQTCAGALATALTVSPMTGLTAGQTAINNFLINQLETNGGLFNYNTRQYLASGRLDHRIDSSNQLSFTYRYGHDLEQSPDVHSLTGFSAGSSIHNYDNNIQGAWYHQFSPTAQNELRVQWDYNSFNVIPNEPGEVGLQIPGFANNLGTNIFLPNYTILRRTEFADNVTKIMGHHTLKFGVDELLRGNHTESHTFFPGRFVFGTLPGVALSPCLANPNGAISANPETSGCALPGVLSPAVINSLQTASLGAPQVYQQGFGDADYPAYTRPLTGLYWQDSWAIASNFTLNYGLRYEIDSQFNPLNTYYGDFGPRVSFAWDPFKDHKTVVRGGYGIFYGPVDAQIAQVDLSLGVLNANKTTVENQHNKGPVPAQVNNLVGTCGIDFPPGMTVFPGTGTSPCNRYISIYVDPLTQTPFAPFLQTSNFLFQGLFNPAGNPSGTNLIACTKPAPGASACITPTDVAHFGVYVVPKGPLSPLQVVFSNQANYKPPYSQQASFGIEREIATGFSISVSGIYSHTLRIPVALDTNLLVPPVMTQATLANGKTVSYNNWNASVATDPLGGQETVNGEPVGVVGYPCANPFACFVNPLIVQNNQYSSAASSLYEAFILEVKKRFSDHFTLFGNYTFSKAFDTSTDFNTDYGPQDPTDLSADRALSEFDQRHKVVIAGVFDSPWKNSVLSGFQFSPIFTYHSGFPFNLLAGGQVNGNNHTTNERPIGASRDTGLGPDFYNFDARLTWTHRLTEKTNIQLTAEGFNIANRTNYASVNNEVNPLFGFQPGFTTFNVHGIKPGTPLPGGGFATPSTPLAFTGDFPKREIQLGVRFNF